MSYIAIKTRVKHVRHQLHNLQFDWMQTHVMSDTYSTMLQGHPHSNVDEPNHNVYPCPCPYPSHVLDGGG